MAVLRLRNPSGDEATEVLESLDLAGHTIVATQVVGDSFLIVYKPRIERVQKTRTPQREVR